MTEVALTKHELTITFSADEHELYPEYKVKCLGKKDDTERNCYDSNGSDNNCNLEYLCEDGYLNEVSEFYQDQVFKVTVHADNIGDEEEPIWSLMEDK